MLENLWLEVDNCTYCKRSGNELQHVHSGGQAKNPRFALVFINPTYQNISTKTQWCGIRFPFIGTRPVWRVLVKSGLLPEKTLQLTEGKWNEETAVQVEQILCENGIYITNVVKCTAAHGNAPSQEAINAQLPRLYRELSIVKPELIIAMGLIPFKALTSETVKLSDFSKQFKTKPKFFHSPVGKTVPCWFPVGRGNPRKAIELLSLIARMYKNFD